MTTTSEVVLDTAADAAMVRDAMQQLLKGYEQVSLADFLDLCGISSTFGDHKVGWTRLINVDIKPVAGGFILDLLPPKEL